MKAIIVLLATGMILIPSAVNAKQGATLPPGLVLACTKSKACKGAVKFLKKRDRKFERACIRKKDLADKAPLLRLLQQIQAQALLYGLDEVKREQTTLCGGILDESVSYIEIRPSEVSLEREEEVQLEAVIHCPPPHYVCTGELIWKSVYPHIATVQDGLVTGVREGTTFVLAGSPDIGIPNFIPAEIVVGTVSVDLALVFQAGTSYTYDWMGYNHPPDVGLIQSANDVASQIDSDFDDWVFSAYSYGGHPSVLGCDASFWSEYYPLVSPPRPHQNVVVGSSSTAEVETALSTFKLHCTEDSSGLTQQHDGTSVYSALDHAIETTPWREDSYRAVILLHRFPACWDWWNMEECGGELGSGLVPTQVVAAATAAGVHIFSVNLSTTMGTGGWGREIEPALRTLANGSGGHYLDATWPMPSTMQTVLILVNAAVSGGDP